MNVASSLSAYASQSAAQSAMDDGSVAAPRVAATANKDQVRKAAQDFETVFVSQMLGHMFEGIKTDGMFGGGQGEDMFKSMMVDEYSKQVVKRGGFGIADSVYKTMLAEQEKHQ